jgi:hypothetical protein
MSDLETRLPELLRDLSTEMSAEEEERRSRSVVRRARRQRALTAAATSLTVIAVIVGGLAGLRALTPATRSTIGNSSDSPTVPVARPDVTPIDAVWPETTADALSFAQAQVDDGHQPWRTDPAMTAEAFAVNVFGWSPHDVRSHVLQTRAVARTAIVEVSRAGGPPTEVMLAQLGTTGADGVWSVTRADTSLLATSVEDTAEDVRSVRVRPEDANADVGVEILGGPGSDAAVSSGNASGGQTYYVLPSESPTGTVVVVVSVLSSGDTVAADVFGVRTATAPGGEASGTAPGAGTSATAAPDPNLVPSSDAIPAAVATTRDEIVRAVEALDFATIRRLIDPNTFSYDFDDGSNPIPSWKNDPTVLDPIPVILRMPPTEPKEIVGYGSFYVWPYLVDSDFQELGASEIDDLHALGFDDGAIDDMRRFGSYLGPRLAIDETGLWRNYTTGGE